MRNVIVTGGSRGLGLGIARKLVQSGFRVIALARKQSDEFNAAQLEEEKAHPGALLFAPFDLAEIDAIPGLAKALHKQYGPIFGLVNNAGMSTDGLLALTSTQKIEQVVRLNTTSPMVLTKHIVRLMMANGSGRIVNISSITAFNGYSGLSVYAATKASLVGFTKSLAREVGRVGVTVNAIAPGFIDTELTNGLGEADRERIVARSALRRLAVPRDVAAMASFLLAESGRNISGAVMTVDAGGSA